LRDLTHGERSIDVKGDTVREVIDRLEERYPGIKDRLIENDRFRR
jgi:sulfur-carrier protein